MKNERIIYLKKTIELKKQRKNEQTEKTILGNFNAYFSELRKKKM